MRSTAIILSGGSGKRFGSEVPKQYLEVCGKQILAYAVEAFEHSIVDEIVIVAADAYLETCRQMVQAGGYTKVKAVIPGGAERYDSVRKGLLYIMEEKGTDVVLIHDGARPLIRPETIREILLEVQEHGAAIAAAPCTDTIKIAGEDGCITGTTERRRTWAAQTPQAFSAQEIFQAYEMIIGNGQQEGRSLTGITDDAMVYQEAFPGRPVKLVNAGSGNFKITAPEDIFRMEGIVRRSHENRDKEA